MEKKRHNYSNLVLLAIIVLFMSTYFFLDSAYTGHVIYEENSYIWDFSDPDAYTYGNNINLTYNEVKLKHLINTTEIITTREDNISLVLAISHHHDVTDKVSSIDNKKAEVKKNNIFNVSFSDNLNNGDVIGLYAKGDDEDSIYVSLCDENVECGSSNYGSVNINGDNYGWYAIIISDLASPANKFNIDTDKEFNLDYINATHYETNAYNETNFYYPQNGSAETNDLEVSNLAYWDMFSYEEDLNNQEIEYYYSLDSGITWNLIENNNLSSVSTASGKIRFKSLLLSDTTLTPSLNQLSITYKTAVACIENWTVNYGACSNKRLIYYIDENSCGTIQNLPADNGTYVDCVPEQGGEQSSSTSSGGDGRSSSPSFSSKSIEIKECKEDWSCTEWSSCIDGVQTRACNDQNNCNKIKTKPPTRLDCEFHEDEIEKNVANETINIEKSKEEPTQKGITGQVIYLLQTNDSAKIFTLIFFLVLSLILHFIHKKFKK